MAMPTGISHCVGKETSVTYALEFGDVLVPQNCCSNRCAIASSVCCVFVAGLPISGTLREDITIYTAATATMPIIAYTIIFLDDGLEIFFLDESGNG